MDKNIRDRIAENQDIEKKTITAWGIDIEVRGMTGKQWDDMQEGDGVKTDTRAKLIIASCYNPESGEKIFTNRDIDMLNTKSATETGKLLTAIYDINGMSEKARSELKKDSAPEGDGTSGS